MVLLFAVGAGCQSQRDTAPQLGPDQSVELAPSTLGDAAKARETALRKLADWVKRNGGQLGVAVGSTAEKTTSLQHDAHARLNPASNMKLVTAAAALDLLGPHFEYTTGVYGKVNGDRVEQLVLRGHGDPSLREADLWRLANAVGERGIKHVGQVLVDQSRFDDQFVPPAFDQQPNEWAAFRAPVSAIALERNTLTLNVLPGEPGKPADIWYEPRGITKTEGSIATKKRGSGQAVAWQLQAQQGALVSTLGGHVAEGLPRLQFSKRGDDPRLLPGLVLTALLEESGVSVQRAPALGGADITDRITYVPSPSLATLLRELGKHSDNFYAEMIFKSLSAEKSETPASSAASAKLVSDWLRQLGAEPKEFDIKNGSGLFDANRLSAATLLTVLRYSYRESKLRNEYLAQLAIGGVDGTLRSRFQRSPKDATVRAKTGTLNDAIALSGYLVPNGAEPALAFVVMVNGIRGKHGAIRAHVDEFVSGLVDQH